MPEKGWVIPRMWPGERGVIVAGGPSVSACQIRQIAKAKLQGRVRVLAVNDSGYLLHGIADWLHASDERWWRGNTELFGFPGIKTTFMQPLHESIHKLGYRRAHPIETEPGLVATGINGGFTAVNIFIQAGVPDIALVGFDMKPAKDGAAHWFGEHAFAATQPEIYDGWRKAFATLPESISALGVKVTNCTPGSTLGMFPTADLGRWL